MDLVKIFAHFHRIYTFQISSVFMNRERFYLASVGLCGNSVILVIRLLCYYVDILTICGLITTLTEQPYSILNVLNRIRMSYGRHICSYRNKYCGKTKADISHTWRQTDKCADRLLHDIILGKKYSKFINELNYLFSHSDKSAVLWAFFNRNILVTEQNIRYIVNNTALLASGVFVYFASVRV